MNAAATPLPQATPDKPWLGLAHFTAEDREYFYGRDLEIRELTDRVRRAPLTLLYGVSGYGKSSLIGAGLIPALEASGHGHITLLRRCYDDLSERSLTIDLLAAAAPHPASTLAPGAVPTLWEFYHDRQQPWLNTNADTEPPPPHVLILDQFEEIFTKGEDRSTTNKAADASARAHATVFLTQLADLVENRPPTALRQQLENGSTEEKRILLRRFDFQVQPVRVLLSFSEEFLGRLERLRRQMPSMMDHRVELRLLAGPQAYQAVYEPGTKRSDLPAIIPPDVAQAIVCAAAGVPAGTDLAQIGAVPPILSLLCERLNANRTTDCIRSSDFSAEEAQRLLKTFYEEKLQPHPRLLREFLESKLASDTGMRETFSLESVLAALLPIQDARTRLYKLVDDRILVIEKRNGIDRVEFTHDTLAKIATQCRAEREAKRKRRRTALGVTAAMIVASLSTVLAFWALKEKNHAEQMARIATQQTALARQRETEATTATKNAEISLAEANLQRNRAEAALDEAKAATKRAEVAVTETRSQKALADSAVTSSKTQKDNAISARNQAENILQYLIGDLQDKLRGRAQLSVLQDVQEKVIAY